jgi:serine/threonine-protein kinase RsbW
MTLTMALTLPGDARSASYARSLLDTLLARLDVAAECREELAVMITEACSNAVRHARTAGDIEVSVALQEQQCVIEVANLDGVFDDVQLHAGLPYPLAEGGRGLPLIGALADVAQILHPRPGWVVLRMAKRIIQR